MPAPSKDAKKAIIKALNSLFWQSYDNLSHIYRKY